MYIALCLVWLKLQPLPSVSALFDLSFLDFSRNRLAVHSLPPGGTSGLLRCSCFGMMRLAAMNFCQAARHCSRSIFVVLILYVWELLWVLKLIHIAFIGYLVGLKSVEIRGNGKVLGILVHELNQVIQEGKDRAAYMNWIKGRKLVNYICIVIAWRI